MLNRVSFFNDNKFHLDIKVQIHVVRPFRRRCFIQRIPQAEVLWFKINISANIIFPRWLPNNFPVHWKMGGKDELWNKCKNMANEYKVAFSPVLEHLCWLSNNNKSIVKLSHDQLGFFKWIKIILTAFTVHEINGIIYNNAVTF